uniref:Uncharacterized protein n=1 Tax=Mimivirus LCMiAC02 TaxID=2506609 RepID=A0A4P6VMQ2_9VIRU|nr:MAG: hypothetical protein LCMiAC02_05320 [Mimivirus LCMiAC02]
MSTNNSKPCLSDYDQKQLDITMAAFGHLPKNDAKIMALTILQEKLKKEKENFEKLYHDVEKQIDDQVEEYINSDQAKKYIGDQVEKYINDQEEKQIYDEVEKKFEDETKKKLKNEAAPLLNFYVKRINNLIIRSNTLDQLCLKEMK